MAQTIKIGVDAVPLTHLHGGIGYYIFYLLEELIALHPEWHFFLYAFSLEGDIEHFKKYPHVTLRACPTLRASHSAWCQTTLAYNVFKDQIDVFWGTTQSIPLLCRKKLKNLLLIHDFAFRLFPQTLSFLKCLYLKMFTFSMVRRADLLLCNSQGTADKLLRMYKRKCHLIIPPPLKPLKERFKPLHNLEHKKYFLTIGTLEPRKNFIALLTFYTHFLHTHKDAFPLVIVGDGGWKNAKIKEALHAAQARFPEKIKYVGRVPDGELSYLLSGARSYLCFSLYEGYGMPLAEARRCNTAVVCFDQSEMREAAENDALFLPSSGYEQLLTQYLCAETIIYPSACRYTSNAEKASLFSQAILDLMRH